MKHNMIKQILCVGDARMRLNTEIGKIYDTIFFLTYHYYEEMVVAHCFKISENLDDDLKYLKIMKEKNLNIPEHISVFFYKDFNYHSLMSDFMFDHLNFETDTFESLIFKLNNKKFFKQYFITKYLPDIKGHELHCMLNNSNNQTVYFIINSMDMPDYFKFQFKMALDLFENMVDDLVNVLKTVYKEVDFLHNTYHREIVEFFNKCKDNDKKKKLTLYFGIKTPDPERFIISYSLLSPYMDTLMLRKKAFFLLGEKAFLSIHKEWNYRHISWESISKALIDPARIKMLQLFFTQKEFSNPQLCRILHYAKSTVAHHIDVLLNEKIIVFTKAVKRTFYYKINKEYFDSLLDFVKNERLKAYGLKIIKNNTKEVLNNEKKETMEHAKDGKFV